MVSGVKMPKKSKRRSRQTIDEDEFHDNEPIGRGRQTIEQEEFYDNEPSTPVSSQPLPLQRGFSFQGQPPQPFTFIDSEWEAWSRTFERYRSVSKLCFESDNIQVDTLILTMGPKAETILESFHLSDNNLKKYSRVVECFNNYFAQKNNIIFERAKFNNRVQKENETVSDFITDLFELSKTCKYGELRDELIRDRIVVGVLDGKLSLSLQMNAELTLESAMDRAKQSELVKTQQKVIRNEPSDDTFSTLAMKHTSKFKSFVCYRCGSLKPHGVNICPAKEAICHNCKKKGHFSTVCKSKKIQIVYNDKDNPRKEHTDELTLDSVSILRIDSKFESVPPLEVKISIDGISVVFKIDTGADITCIPEALLPTLRKSQSDLKGFNGRIEHAGRGRLSCLGTFDGELKTCSGRSSTQRVFVLKNLNNPLLGRPAIRSLNLLTMSAEVHQISNDRLVQVKDNFTTLFSDVPGVMAGGHHHIRLKEGAKRYAVSAPRRVPLPLYEKVREELVKMEKNGTISKVEEATE